MIKKRTTLLLLASGFLFLGGVVGTLLAMSAQSLVQAVIAGLFALFGGSILALLEKLPEEGQGKAALSLLAISVGTLLGVYSGLYVNERQLLTPENLRLSKAKLPAGATPTAVPRYLRENFQDARTSIDMKYRNKFLSAEDAYDSLRKLTDEQ